MALGGNQPTSTNQPRLRSLPEFHSLEPFSLPWTSEMKKNLSRIRKNGPRWFIKFWRFFSACSCPIELCLVLFVTLRWHSIISSVYLFRKKTSLVYHKRVIFVYIFFGEVQPQNPRPVNPRCPVRRQGGLSLAARKKRGSLVLVEKIPRVWVDLISFCKTL